MTIRMLAAGIVISALGLFCEWTIFAYAAADLWWPVTALSWSDAGHFWLVPPSLCRLIIIVATLLIGALAFLGGVLAASPPAAEQVGP